MSSKRRIRRRESGTCARKRRYWTEGGAWFAAMSATIVYRDPYGLHVYRCPVVDEGGVHWHIAHRRAGKRTRADLRSPH